MEKYKSWSGLKKQLEENICGDLRGRITYFLTMYHDVHNSYGRAAVCLEGSELIVFSHDKMILQENDISSEINKNTCGTYGEAETRMKPYWDEECIYSEVDFLDSAIKFRSMSIREALASDNYIIKILAVVDRRTGKRTLAKLRESGEYETYPEWVRQFFRLRFSFSEN